MDTSFELLEPTRTIPEDQHGRLETACTGFDAPVAAIDLHALSANAHCMIFRAGNKPVRIASKSIRSTEVLRAILATDGFAGVLAFSLAEAIMLVRAGISDDVVVGYPTTATQALQTLLNDPQLLAAITLMADHPDQLRFIEQTAPAVAPIRVCLDVDMSLSIGKLHMGTRRSPIRTADQARSAAEYITASKGYRLVGVMGYEAQIAGVPDDNAAVRTIKRTSIPELRARRQQMVAAVEGVLAKRHMPPLAFVNGGGTGSIESTTVDESVTEIAAGSGLYGPHLFDRYDAFTPHPAALFGLDLVRAPTSDMITVQGGGWIASGSPGKDRMPQPVYPPGLSYTTTEGAGEVQTPLKTSTQTPKIGQRVWFRHTKAGELAEHVNHLHIITEDRITATVNTYRGDGHALV